MEKSKDFRITKSTMSYESTTNQYFTNLLQVISQKYTQKAKDVKTVGWLQLEAWCS